MLRSLRRQLPAGGGICVGLFLAVALGNGVPAASAQDPAFHSQATPAQENEPALVL